ncbi:uncharacterized protein LOC131439493 [Malaya genurostris]|uniref:uncharacterized protein LOC131439493 n=1 Tax=Malaya genurostris TaxID=325434 RepID=UPI0026F39B98|nr:uncharacterized protein LOC131439493 [Malaya genurostris]
MYSSQNLGHSNEHPPPVVTVHGTQVQIPKRKKEKMKWSVQASGTSSQDESNLMDIETVKCDILRALKSPVSGPRLKVDADTDPSPIACNENLSTIAGSGDRNRYKPGIIKCTLSKSQRKPESIIDEDLLRDGEQSELSENDEYDMVTKLTLRVKKLKALSLRLKKQCSESNRRCLRLTDFLNISGNTRQRFTYIEGMLTEDQLEAFSRNSKSDYVFVKLLMFEIWQEGFKGRTIYGRMSNNPRGRKPILGNSKSHSITSYSTSVPLEPDKVQYIYDRLYEHRMMKGDSPLEANEAARNFKDLIRRVLAYYKHKNTHSLEP